MPREALDDDIEADVREAYADGTAAADAGSDWARHLDDTRWHDRRAAADSERADAHYAREREETKQRHREARRGDAGRDGWRTRPKAEPPKGLTENGLEEWQREQDVREAFDETHGRAQENTDLEGYHREASESGTTLRDALGRYTSFEKLIKADPLRGLAAVAANAGVEPQHLADYFGRMAGHDALGFTRGGAQAGLHREVNAAHGSLGAVNAANAAIDAAARQLPGFAAMEDAIAEAFEKGQVQLTGDMGRDLLAAYHMVSSRRAGERAAGARAQNASRSISGSSVGEAPAGPRRRTGSYDDDLEADVRAAYRGG